ncbi:probable RNA-binding protein 46 [Nephila pilipes]|uniref:Probable RNA-binding protein 46 n=1 Tax=Nephila pilipes TaxID=299642 RepID=A0A8X6UMQ9_NEPPI|nr:probable RNA-binding protein 46 [Nephila pilipes]
MFSSFRDTELKALAEKTGYKLSLQNEQRIYGPPPGWIGSPPSIESKLFIENLPSDLYELELVPLCEQFGKIYELHLKINENGENCGEAFLIYTNSEDAFKALQVLDNFEIRPNHYIVCKPINCRSLFITGKPIGKTEEERLNEVSKFTEGVTKVVPYEYRIAKYSDHQDVYQAKSSVAMNKGTLFDRELEMFASSAQPNVEMQYEEMRKFQIKSLCVRKIALKTTEAQLHILFSLEGSLEVEILKKVRDFGFIQYKKREHAEIALVQLNGIRIDGSALEVSWAKVEKKRATTGRRDNNNLYQYSNTDGRERSSLKYQQNASIPMISKGNVQSRAQIPTFPNLDNHFELLQYICTKNGWGKPKYNIYIEPESPALFFSCWVSISGFPHHKFVSDKVCKSTHEARIYAASYVLKKLNIITNTPNPGACSSDSNHFNDIKQMPVCFGARSQVNIPDLNASGNLPFSNNVKDQNEKNIANPNVMSEFDFSELSGLLECLEPNTPIESNSVLGLFAQMFALSKHHEAPPE